MRCYVLRFRFLSWCLGCIFAVILRGVTFCPSSKRRPDEQYLDTPRVVVALTPPARSLLSYLTYCRHWPKIWQKMTQGEYFTWLIGSSGDEARLAPASSLADARRRRSSAAAVAHRTQRSPRGPDPQPASAGAARRGSFPRGPIDADETNIWRLRYRERP